MKKVFTPFKNNYYVQKGFPFGVCLLTGLVASVLCFVLFAGSLALPIGAIVYAIGWSLLTFIVPLCFIIGLFLCLPPLKQGGVFDKITSIVCFWGWCYASFYTALSVSAVFINKALQSPFLNQESLYGALHRPFMLFWGVLTSCCLTFLWKGHLLPKARVPFLPCRGAWVAAFFAAGISFYLILFQYEAIVNNKGQTVLLLMHQ